MTKEIKKLKKELKKREQGIKAIIMKGYKVRNEIIQLKHTIKVMELDEERKKTVANIDG